MVEAPSAAPGHGGGLDGWFEGGAHILPVRIYYEDTDFTGIVYHGSYVRFMERGRSAFLSLAGISHRALAAREGEALAFAVRHMEIDFLRPARIDDTLQVVTRYENVVGARIIIAQEIKRGDDRLISARIEVVCISMSGRPRRLPASILRQLEPFVGGGAE